MRNHVQEMYKFNKNNNKIKNNTILTEIDQIRNSGCLWINFHFINEYSIQIQGFFLKNEKSFMTLPNSHLNTFNK